jgi:hypothetical protein
VDAQGRFRAEHEYGTEGSGKTYPIRVLPHDDTLAASEYTATLKIESTNLPPEFEDLKVVITGAPNRAVASGGLVDPEGRGPIRLEIDWGDGVLNKYAAHSYGFSYPHLYDVRFPGTYNVRLYAYDVDGLRTVAFGRVSISNVGN